MKTVTEMASRGLRTLCLAYADVSADKVEPLDKLEGPPQLALTACCMLGIKVSTQVDLLCGQILNSRLMEAGTDGIGLLTRQLL